MNRDVELAAVTVRQCQLRLRRVQEQVRSARESLRRAVRAADDAELELGDATRRLTRMESPRPEAPSLGWRVRQGGMQPTVYMRSEGK